MFIFVLGFVMMTPQLYINYKLKSVDHLPWKTLIYRFISTIIDDIFVFMIELPWLQRMFSFRDGKYVLTQILFSYAIWCREEYTKQIKIGLHLLPHRTPQRHRQQFHNKRQLNYRKNRPELSIIMYSYFSNFNIYFMSSLSINTAYNYHITRHYILHNLYYFY